MLFIEVWIEQISSLLNRESSSLLQINPLVDSINKVSQ